jgi:hypothetical protein
MLKIYLKEISRTFLFVLTTSYCFGRILETPACEADTSRAFYFSFEQNKTVEYQISPDMPLNEKLEVCEGARVYLESPLIFESALYFWEGPDGFRSNLPRVVLENVQEENAGKYYLQIKRPNQTIGGFVELNIHAKPSVKCTMFESSKFLKIATDTNEEPDLIIKWKNSLEEIIGQSETMTVKKEANSKVLLTVSNKTCERTFEFAPQP